MKTIIIIILIVLLIFIIYKYFNKKMITYDYKYFTINIEDLKDAPKWLKFYDEISITEIKKTKHIKNKNYNDIFYNHEIKLYSNGYDIDDDF